MIYYKSFRNIRKDVIFRVRAFVKSNPWCGSAKERQEKFEMLLHDLSKIYKISQPTLHISNRRNAGDGYCVGNHIEMPRYSVVTLLHEFKHLLQQQRKRRDTETIARRWSLSLYYRAAPAHFIRAAKKGQIFFVKEATRKNGHD